MSTQQPASSKTFGEHLVEKTNEAVAIWAKSFNEGNAAGAADCYTADAEMHAQPKGKFKGTEEIKGFWQFLIDNKFSDVKYKVHRIIPVSQTQTKLYASWQMNNAHGYIHNETWEMQADGKMKLVDDHFQIFSDEDDIAEQDEKKLKEDIHVQMDSFLEFLSKGDLDAYRQHFSEDVHLYLDHEIKDKCSFVSEHPSIKDFFTARRSEAGGQFKREGEPYVEVLSKNHVLFEATIAGKDAKFFVQTLFKFDEKANKFLISRQHMVRN